MDRITLKKQFKQMLPGEARNRVYEPGEYEVAENPDPGQISPRGAKIAVDELRIAEWVKGKSAKGKAAKADEKAADEVPEKPEPVIAAAAGTAGGTAGQ